MFQATWKSLEGYFGGIGLTLKAVLFPCHPRCYGSEPTYPRKHSDLSQLHIRTHFLKPLWVHYKLGLVLYTLNVLALLKQREITLFGLFYNLCPYPCEFRLLNPTHNFVI